MSADSYTEIDGNGIRYFFSFTDDLGHSLFMIAHNGEAVTASINDGHVLVMLPGDAVQLRDWLNDVLLDVE